MIKIKLSAGSKYSRPEEARAVENLQRILSGENGYLIPVLFIGKQISNREIDAVLILPDAIFFLDFKEWLGQRIEVGGLNGKVRRFFRGAWEDGENTLPNYEYAARIMAGKLRKQARQWLPVPPRIYSALVFTRRPSDIPARVSFAGGDPGRPVPKDGVGACNIEQLPQLISAFRIANNTSLHLTDVQQSTLADFFLNEAKPVASKQRRIEGYLITAEHHVDTFLDCKIYQGEGELLDEHVWIKEYERIFTSSDERDQRDRLVLRHADILHRFPQHKNVVDYRAYKATDFHLYVILSRKPGAFLNELLYEKPLGNTTLADLQQVPFNLHARLQILDGLLRALEYLTQQPGFEHSAYRDLRPDSIFIQNTDALPVAQLFNFDCTKLPGATTKRSNMRSGQKRSPVWDDYASPELLDYIHSVDTTSNVGFTGDSSSDLFSWATIAWELLTGELPFSDTESKLQGKRNPWPDQLVPQLQEEADKLSDDTIQLIKACLHHSPAKRPKLAVVRRQFS